MTGHDVIVNELAQWLRPMSQGIEWFDGLIPEEQSETLLMQLSEVTGARCFAAGCWHRVGLGTAPDRVQAVRWFPTMFYCGNADGIHEAIQLVKRGMTDEQIRTAGELAVPSRRSGNAHPWWVEVRSRPGKAEGGHDPDLNRGFRVGANPSATS